MCWYKHDGHTPVVRDMWFAGQGRVLNTSNRYVFSQIQHSNWCFADLRFLRTMGKQHRINLINNISNRIHLNKIVQYLLTLHSTVSKTFQERISKPVELVTYLVDFKFYCNPDALPAYSHIYREGNNSLE